MSGRTARRICQVSFIVLDAVVSRSGLGRYRERSWKQLPVDIEREPGSQVCVVRLEAEIDLAVVPEIREKIAGVLETGCAQVVMDLSSVTYADSSALGLLVWIDHKLTPKGGKLVVAGATKDVSRVLEISGLVGVAPSIASSPNVGSALEGLALPEAVAEPLWTESMSFPARVDELGAVRRKVCDVLEHVHMTDASMFDIKVAVGEALANAVRHGSPQGQEDEVDVDVTAYDDRVVIEVRDQGCGFDGVHACANDVYASSGRGVMFMRALMDRVEFEPLGNGGTKVRLVKHLPSEGAPQENAVEGRAGSS